MTRAIMLALVAGVTVLLWCFAPYGAKHSGGEALTFAGQAFDLGRDMVRDLRRTAGGRPLDIGVFALEGATLLGVLTLLYPAILSLTLLARNRRRLRSRAVWIIQGALVLAMTGAGTFAAVLSLATFGFGRTTPELYAAFWAVPGLAALAGLLALSVGIAPHGAIARRVL